jgi:plastocyanin
MKVPAIFGGVVLIAIGVAAPSALPQPKPAPPGAVGMEHEKFTGADTITIARGGSVTFYNNSSWLHVIGPGDEGRLKSEPGAPYLGDRGVFISETDDTFVAGPWNTPGTYHITCQLHPEMNVTVIVTG